MSEPSDATHGAGRGGSAGTAWRATALACLFLAALALWVRSLYRALVLTPGGILPVDPDAFYHFRRIAYSVRSFPASLSFDTYLNFPRGGEPIWSPAFDLAGAALVRALLGATPDPAALERLLCFVPPVLGALHVALLFLLGRRFLSAPAAFAAALLLAILPAHFSYSQLGFVDHHVAVSLAGSLVLFAAMAFAARPGRWGAVGLALAFAGSLLLWPGGLIHVGVAQAALLGFCLSRASREDGVDAARRLAVAHAAAALLVAPFGLGRSWIRWGAWSPLVLSSFQPLWLAAGALCFGVLGEAWTRVGFPRSLARRAAGAAAVGLAVAALALAALPELASRGAADALAWMTRGEEFQAVVRESQPLLMRNGRLRLWPAVVLLSGGLLLAPVAVAGLLGAARRQGRPELGVLALWASAFLVLGAVQRFVADAGPALALLLFAAVDARLAGTSPLRRRRLALAAAAAGLVLALPVLDFYAKRPVVGRSGRRTQALAVDVARWLHAHSPPTAGWLGGGPPPAYGVLAPWGVGHALRYVAERPVVQDNFGDDVGEEGFAAAEAYFSADTEDAGLRILDALRVRYVLVGPTGSGHGRGSGPAGLFAQLRRAAGAPLPEAGGADAGPAGSPARHRLVYESDAFDPRGTGGTEPHFALFEVVPGARLYGRAAPGSEVEARLALRSERGRRFEFLARAAADAGGRYVLTLPYATGEAGAVGSAPRYELRGGGGSASVSIAEEDVLRGAELVGPALSPDASTAPPSAAAPATTNGSPAALRTVP